MKKNLVAFFGLSRWGVGAVVLALCAFTSASRADAEIVVNTSQTTEGYSTAAVPEAVLFTISSAANIGSLTLVLSGSGSSDAYVYNAPSGAIASYGTALYNLGSISASSPTISGLNDSLSAGEYAIVLANSGSTWGFTTSSTYSGSATSFGESAYWNGTSWVGQSLYFQMDLEPVPEVPMTGMVMGFGALAIAVGGTLRRKLRPAVSSIA